MVKRDSSGIVQPVLITGAGGFLGHHLTRELTARGLAVRALVRPGRDTDRLESWGAVIVRGDLSNPSQVREAVEGCGTVFHLAALRGPLKLPRRTYLTINRQQAETIGRASLDAGVSRVILTSTTGIARCNGGAPSDETSPPRPNSAYRESKLRAEEVLLDLGAHGLNVVIARFSSVLGPGAIDWRRDFQKVRSGRLRYLPAGGVTHLVDVDDVIQGLRLCAEVPGVEGERFILASGEPVSVRDLYLAIADAVGTRLSVRELPGAPFRAFSRAADLMYRVSGWALPFGFTCERLAARRPLRINKARAMLGFLPRWDLPAMVARTAVWMREKGWL